ncbi:hypothetical protein [Cytobacillus praedii]|uniref:hypothetical protein n=1 Tax=Cytobacillus praedii TaxID=1742358 RepID=UPI003AF46FD2
MNGYLVEKNTNMVLTLIGEVLSVGIDGTITLVHEKHGRGTISGLDESLVLFCTDMEIELKHPLPQNVDNQVDSITMISQNDLINSLVNELASVKKELIMLKGSMKNDILEVGF